MVARVTQVQVKPEDIDEAVALFDQSVIPAAEQEQGFLGALLLVRPDGHAMAVDLCDTREHMEANERNGFYQTQIVKFAGKLIGRPTRKCYDVPVAKGVRGGLDLLEPQT
jgi:hypothetical protein